MKPHLFHLEADHEYAEAAQHFSQIIPELGGRFYDEIERLIADVCERPQLLRAFDPLARRHLAGDFPYALVYLDEPECV